MVQRAMVLLCVCSLAMFLMGCGQTYELQSITVSPTTASLEGINATQALTVTAHYSNSKTQDVTIKSSYQVSQATALTDPNTPNGAVSVSGSGVVETSNSVWACTWVTTSAGSGYIYGITSPYVVTVSYGGFTTTSAIAVASGPTCYDGIGYKHPA